MAILGEEQKNLQKEREDLIKRQFAKGRTRLRGAEKEAKRQSKQGFDRLKARTGSTGGSIAKARQEGIEDIGQKIGEVRAGIDAQEAGALSQAKAQEQQLTAQESQFQRTLDFQKDSFADQMAFQWAEFDENKRTNFINAAIALKEAGLRSRTAWASLLGPRGAMREFYPEAPAIGGGLRGPGDKPSFRQIVQEAGEA